MISSSRLDLALVTLSLALAAPLLGAAAPETTWKFEGELRVRPEYNDNYDFDSGAADSRDFTLLRTTLGVRFERGPRMKGFLQLRDSRRFGFERNATGGIPGNTASSQGNVDLHQGYVDYRPGGEGPWTWRIGRQEIILGDERVVGSLNWGNVGRSFDGVRGMRKVAGGHLDLFAFEVGDVVTTARDDQELKGAQWSRTVDRRLVELYWLHFQDDIALSARSQTGVAGSQDFHTFGVRSKGPLGGLDYTVEAAAQRGDFSIDDLSAEAFALVLGKNLPGRHKRRVELEWNYSPGDEAKAGTRGTWQNLFPTNHKHYGIADRMSWQNTRSWRLSHMFQPRPGRKVRLDLHRHLLDDTRDAWRAFNGRVVRGPSPGAPRDLGWELAARLFLTDGPVKWQGGVSRVFAGDHQRVTHPAGRADDATFAYVMGTFPF